MALRPGLYRGRERRGAVRRVKVLGELDEKGLGA